MRQMILVQEEASAQHRIPVVGAGDYLEAAAVPAGGTYSKGLFPVKHGERVKAGRFLG